MGAPATKDRGSQDEPVAGEMTVRGATRRASDDPGREARWAAWLKETIEASNERAEKHGPPLAKYRLFQVAQFDVYRRPDGPGQVVDRPSDLLGAPSHRLVAPLVSAEFAPPFTGRFNPTCMVEGLSVRMPTQFGAAVPKTELGVRVASSAEFGLAVTGAVDLLPTGA